MIEIDGSVRSGSGVIVRQAVAYAALTGQPVRVRNARARREHPGLRPQHVRAIQAIADLVGGALEGAEVGSGSFAFWPGEAEPGGRYEWDIGTAGSATMLALAVLPVMAARGRGAQAEIRGGLFQDFAPSVFHLQRIIVPLLAQMGITAELGLIRPGYVPAGEGVIRLTVMPARGPLRPLTLARGEAPPRISGISLASHLQDRRVAERMAAAARAVLQTAGVTGAIDIAEVRDRAAAQPGAAFALFAEFTGGARLGADRAGAPHRRAESIGARAARELLEDIASGATIDRHASDQIIPFTALAGGTSTFRVSVITEHAETSGWLASAFLGAEVSIGQQTLAVRGQATQHRSERGPAGPSPPASHDAGRPASAG
jgi:RNA 3'-terminal phosphate cyclase (ATP)